MPNTYELIASSTVGSGGAANIEFASIPVTYTDLVFKISARSTSTGSALDRYATFQFNSSTTNRTFRRLYGYSSTAGSDSGSFGYAFSMSGTTGTASTFCNAELYIPNYATTTQKSFSQDGASEQNSTTLNWLDFNAFLWADTSAITNIKFVPDAGNFAEFSTFYLYGVKSS
tara:strand:+ start:1875 stop:2390 length:516 start_codon:yes stop_codon:yes gene_type:complete